MKKTGLACLAVLLVASVSVGCKKEDDGKFGDKKAQLETTVSVDEVPLPEISAEQKQTTAEQAQVDAEQKQTNAEQKATK